MLGLCIDNFQESVHTDACRNDAAQTWTMNVDSSSGNDPGTWVNRDTGRCLEADPSGAVAAEFCRNGDATQRWTQVFIGDVSRFMNAGNSLCLDTDVSGSAFLSSCTSNSSQLWYTATYGATFVNFASGRCLSTVVTSGAGPVSTSACGDSNNNDPLLAWTYDTNGRNIPITWNPSGRCLDGTDPAHLVVQDCAQGNEQVWQERL
nr:ricin-type beta-trefoil lectin domain protein [Fodinicola feengrottensis]